MKPMEFWAVGLVVVLAPLFARAQAAAPPPPANAPEAQPPPDEAPPDDVYVEEELPGGPPPHDRFEPPFYGFYFGAAAATSVDFQGDDLCSELAGCKDMAGGGLDLSIGVRFSPMFKLQGAYDVFWHGSTSPDAISMVQSWRLDGRLGFPLRHNLEPFAQLGFGLYTYGDQFGIDTIGPGLQAGGGGDFALGRRFSLVGTVLYRMSRFDSVDPDGVEDLILYHAVTVSVGVSFGPGI